MPVMDVLTTIGGQAWAADAACGRGSSVPHDAFFARGLADIAAVKRYCTSRCPVQEECLEDAMRMEESHRERFGVRGGMSARARRQLAAQRRKAAEAELEEEE
ncbi:MULTISPECIES: WhiB family transcriptional regulator [Streptomyces]|uniref:WhiB family transcriptional regulator n=1 Tax=Streptomyces doudnae TaxID=3075536 RepID=A0ABD5EM82_9ACTN|nr:MULTISPECIES: WhiB family transcriptional regulator [unclassified Streptomyces]MDT0435681.1 WhiB family transcriptional regulator [Streptomyces sp. DSM 41981]MYQ62634.1 WhiB family transcriptional regulator [Streptomyces sp. SID4950]SCD41148.1 Transcription factor WhiB [Streptomyces sp. SolWspMP-5a-2]